MTQITLTTPTGESVETTLNVLLKQSKYTVLYFYPKDDTPGCTLEAQGFNVLLPEFQKCDVQIIGVSHDPHKSHCKFVSKYGLGFPLIADTDLIIHNDPRFNTRGEKSMYGKKYMGTMRQTFVLDVSGNVVKSRDKVDTKAHAQEVLEWAKEYLDQIIKIYKMKKVLVQDSSIQGKGVFATEEIKQGDLVLEIDDSHIVTDDMVLSEEEKDHLDYLPQGKVLMQSPEVFINHSCNPNVYVKTIDGIRTVIAIRDIKTGKEICYDYAINGDYDRGVVCHCGSENCRGKLDNNFWHLPLRRQIDYIPYLDDRFIQQHQSEYNNLIEESKKQ